MRDGTLCSEVGTRVKTEIRISQDKANRACGRRMPVVMACIQKPTREHAQLGSMSLAHLSHIGWCPVTSHCDTGGHSSWRNWAHPGGPFCASCLTLLLTFCATAALHGSQSASEVAELGELWNTISRFSCLCLPAHYCVSLYTLTRH